jgi:hypothetical protein
MYEYRINVAINGTHLFRTDWYDVDSASNAATVIKSSMPLADVTVSRRTTAMQVASVGTDLSFQF